MIRINKKAGLFDNDLPRSILVEVSCFSVVYLDVVKNTHVQLAHHLTWGTFLQPNSTRFDRVQW